MVTDCPVGLAELTRAETDSALDVGAANTTFREQTQVTALVPSG
jgi:hypothetical protein